jgi:hypothetical protein
MREPVFNETLQLGNRRARSRGDDAARRRERPRAFSRLEARRRAPCRRRHSGLRRDVAQADRGNGVILGGEFAGARVAYLGSDCDLGVVMEIFSGTPGDHSQPFPTLPAAGSEPEGSIKGSISTARWRSCKPSREKRRRLAAFLQSPLTDSNRRPPPYHAIQTATGGSRWQRFVAKSNHFRALDGPSVCDRLRPLCSITVPSQ